MKRYQRILAKWRRFLDAQEPETVGDAVDLDMDRDDLDWLGQQLAARSQSAEAVGWVPTATNKGESEPCEYSKLDRSGSVWRIKMTWVASVNGLCLNDISGRAIKFGSKESAMAAVNKELKKK